MSRAEWGVVVGLGTAVISTCCGLAGYLLGERNAITAQMERERAEIAPVLAADPAFSRVEIVLTYGKGVVLLGKVTTWDDLDRLKTALVTAVGKKRSDEMTTFVQVEQRDAPRRPK